MEFNIERSPTLMSKQGSNSELFAHENNALTTNYLISLFVSFIPCLIFLSIIIIIYRIFIVNVPEMQCFI